VQLLLRVNVVAENPRSRGTELGGEAGIAGVGGEGLGDDVGGGLGAGDLCGEKESRGGVLIEGVRSGKHEEKGERRRKTLQK